MPIARLPALLKQRFARQLALPEIGDRGQRQLLAGRVLLVGAGGLGSPAGLYLAAAGVGTIGIVDDDTVELGNLQRQIFHATADVGRLKVESAAEKMRAIHPAAAIQVYPKRLTARNAAAIFRDYDFIVDAVDNVETKWLIARACRRLQKPYSYGGIFRHAGQTMTIHPGQTACLGCVFADLLPATDSVPRGPLGVVPGVIGTIQAAEAIKHLLSIGTPLTNRLLTFDALDMNLRWVRVNRTPTCALCRVV
ncbi:MAG: HesA/MoeB/ThiF family protein [Verrucomicrobia bacterium]|nr:HesA/MoeB/ThiF family protein [Verrucomicrobiota bacterium]MCG2680999.1 HesA/MoeB/ThiF family protein [Kiritimatiellia bacterium]MBU4247779.1 HesA/MoeB/ThiF family protein [Verrucomicrobiota bacterium]MBU4292067.1 HesA/MoeB/ThiF family protein [Verrucomicrobiota bacterium]MBU4427860.1 HesA/MoeB/ThiF family protein [Verrucomicrobiota bacterium]